MTGVLKGFDQLLNLVLDEVEETLLFGQLGACITHLYTYISTETSSRTRSLGLVVLRGPTITLLSPVDGWEEIANPFLQQEGA